MKQGFLFFINCEMVYKKLIWFKLENNLVFFKVTYECIICTWTNWFGNLGWGGWGGGRRGIKLG